MFNKDEWIELLWISGDHGAQATVRRRRWRAETRWCICGSCLRSDRFWRESSCLLGLTRRWRSWRISRRDSGNPDSQFHVSYWITVQRSVQFTRFSVFTESEIRLKGHCDRIIRNYSGALADVAGSHKDPKLLFQVTKTFVRVQVSPVVRDVIRMDRFIFEEISWEELERIVTEDIIRRLMVRTTSQQLIQDV